jgi:transcriptional regulator GlxA family with amidase domain
MKRLPELPLEEAIKVLEREVREIDRVSEWAKACNYSSSKLFSRKFRNHFGIRPITIIKKLKVKIAINLLKNTQLSNYEIALEIGKRDEQALYHFIKQQTGNSPEFYKKKIREKNKRNKS